jgi:hypothetical protein
VDAVAHCSCALIDADTLKLVGRTVDSRLDSAPEICLDRELLRAMQTASDMKQEKNHEKRNLVSSHRTG